MVKYCYHIDHFCSIDHFSGTETKLLEPDGFCGRLWVHIFYSHYFYTIQILEV